MNEYKILVIDDEVTLAEFIKKILIELNNDERNILVETANTGNDGIEIAKKFSPDVVLLDIKLPDISGIKILSLLKQLDPDVQVIIMTGFASLDTAVVAVREGAYDYINKPFDSSDQLKALVRNAMERRHLVIEKKQLMHELTEVNQALEDANKILEEKKQLVDKKLEEKISELQKLNEFARTLASEIDLSHLIDLINKEALKVTSGKGCLLLLFDKTKNVLIAMKSNEAFPLKQGDTVELNSGPFGLINNKSAWKFNNTMCASLKFGNENIGIICFKKDNIDSLKDLIETMASYISVSLHNAMLFESLKSSYIEAVLSLMLVEESKDPKIRTHALNVADLSAKLANELGIDKEEIQDIRYAALLHDIGKIGEGIEMHTAGEKILSPLKFLKRATIIVKHQFENFDGSGKPNGLKGKEIPLGSRIIAVANRFDELVSNEKSDEGAFNKIKSTKIFDPEVVEMLKKVLKKKGIEI